MSSLHGATKQSTMAASPLVLVLLGKTGMGKSSTANTILQNREFKAASHTTSCSMVVSEGLEKEIRGQILHICDTPGAFETQRGNENITCEQRTCQIVDDIFRIFHDSGVHAFVLVFSYVDPRFTEEDKRTIKIYKEILGEDFISKHGIIAFTHGDNFDKTEHIHFSSWCASQVGTLKDLLNECGNRVVLMYNSTDEEYQNKCKESSEEIINLATELKDRTNIPAYSWDDYNKRKTSRIKLVLKSK
ncbi:unnamed protein product, partial [Lymnaea stagnalis]